MLTGGVVIGGGVPGASRVSLVGLAHHSHSIPLFSLPQLNIKVLNSHARLRSQDDE